ncbi:MAG TPA: ABC transporter ATP-binding protein [Candidatus Limnocylindrales bacterium]|nr:ABC transporter ATP-binding protein [Candidatus Limnocylindrales bacterium]
MDQTLKISDLNVQFYTRRGIYRALNGVDLSLKQGEIFGIAGESGCGKTTMGLTIIGLLPVNAAVTDGQAMFCGERDLIASFTKAGAGETDKFNLRKSEAVVKKVNKELADVRGSRISMVFQDPMTSLNPVLQVGFQIAETVLTHQPRSLAERKLARARATPEDTEQIVNLLKEGADEQAITKYAESKGLQGIETQVLNVWRRNDLGEAKKEKIILSLHSEKLGSFEKIVLESVEKGTSMPGWMKIPGISRAAKNVLLKEGYTKAIELLSMLEVPNPDKVVRMYPHELSGGMRQRIVIAIALANNPDLVILDEPTSALDVTVQAQILELTRHLKQRFNTSFIFISHDLSVLSEVCDRIGIMYAGTMVEVAPTDEIFNNPIHPYTRMLTRAIPRIEGSEIQGVGGTVPDMRKVPLGCTFNPRCPDATEQCRTKKPEMVEVEGGHFVACYT